MTGGGDLDELVMSGGSGERDDSMNWIRVGERNLDELPSFLTPSVGCPSCGSVFVHYTHVGFIPDWPMGGRFFAEGWIVQPLPMPVPPLAARLECFDGHVVSFNGRDLRVLEPPMWAKLGIHIGVTAAVLSAYALTRRP